MVTPYQEVAIGHVKQVVIGQEQLQPVGSVGSMDMQQNNIVEGISTLRHWSLFKINIHI